MFLCRNLLLNGNSLLKFTELWRGFYIVNVGGGAICHFFDMESGGILRRAAETWISPIEMGPICVHNSCKIHCFEW